MKINEMLRLLGWNLAGALLLIICYSDIFLGLSFSDRSAFRATCALVIGPAVLLLLAVYDYRHLLKNNVTINEANDSEDIEYLLNKYDSTIFAKQVMVAREQLKLFEKRERVFQTILDENDLEDSTAFRELTEHLERQILLNVQKALRIMQVFNYDRYRAQGAKADPAYYEQIRSCNACVATNEQIITHFDELISEISKVHEEEADNSMQRAADMAAALRRIRTADGEDSTIGELARKYEQ